MFCNFAADVRYIFAAQRMEYSLFSAKTLRGINRRGVIKRYITLCHNYNYVFSNLPFAVIFCDKEQIFILYIQSLKSAVDKYLSPLSGRRATIVLPLFSGRFASSTAAKRAAPALIPTSTPSLFPMSLP